MKNKATEETQKLYRLTGKRIKESLELNKISQREMVEMLGITPNALNTYVTGRRQTPLEVVATVARKCNVSADYLLGLREEMTPLLEDATYAEDLEFIKASYTKLPLEQRQALLALFGALKK